MSTTRTRRFGVPLALLVLVVAAVVFARGAGGGSGYHAQMAHAGGLRAGDKVRVAGLDVGTVDAVQAERDTVHVDFSVSGDAELTRDTTVQVKLASLLGERYLALEPGDGATLEEGDTIAKEHARNSFTMEEFWLEATPKLEALDVDRVESAIDVLGSELATAPKDVRSALRGMTGLSRIVTKRDAQMERLLASTEQITSTVIDQQDELDELMSNSGKVLNMVHRRREVLRTLLRDSRTLAAEVTSLARSTQKDLDPMLAELETVVGTLQTHKADLDEILRKAGPTMRLYTNASGDGPWLGVNAPYFVFPDDLYCTLGVPALECR